MTFLIKVKKAGEVKGAVAAITAIEGAATVELTDIGVVIRVIHPTRNLIAVLKLKKSGLHHYSCNRPPYLLHLCLPDLFSLLSSAADDDELTLSCLDPTASLLLVIYSHAKRESRQLSLAVTEATTASRWTTDESAYEYCVSFPAPHFRRNFASLHQFHHTVKITLTEEVAKLSAGLMHLTVGKEHCLIHGVDSNSSRKVKLSLEHLESIIKASRLTKVVQIYNAAVEPPIRPLISCPLGPLATLHFFLPRPFYYFSSSE